MVKDASGYRFDGPRVPPAFTVASVMTLPTAGLPLAIALLIAGAI